MELSANSSFDHEIIKFVYKHSQVSNPARSSINREAHHLLLAGDLRRILTNTLSSSSDLAGLRTAVEDHFDLKDPLQDCVGGIVSVICVGLKDEKG